MTVDPKILAALSKTLAHLRDGEHRAIPVNVLEALAPLAKLGLHLKIDLDATQKLGAPLISLQQDASSLPLFEDLTPRQKQVANLLIDGRSNKQISSELNISLATVKDHVHAILQQHDLPSRAAVMAAARSV